VLVGVAFKAVESCRERTAAITPAVKDARSSVIPSRQDESRLPGARIGAAYVGYGWKREFAAFRPMTAFRRRAARRRQQGLEVVMAAVQEHVFLHHIDWRNEHPLVAHHH
jgi:hypothetical protein